MTNITIALLAYLLDRKFGEYSFIKHPVIFMGELISYFEKHYYKPTLFRGFLLVVFMLGITGSLAFVVEEYLSLLPTFVTVVVGAFLSSMFVAHHMLREAVLGVTTATDKKHAISMLVSRDTQHLSESEIYKAAIETYAENLSDGVVAPLFYLVLFGFPGIVVYKTINTLDSMVGYRNERYEKFGKVAARLDDVANFIPSRLTALLIMVCAKQKKPFAFYKYGKKHESPNAGHPISAMAIALGVSLGGDTSYFGKVKQKPHFAKGRKTITKGDVLGALEVL